MQGWMKSWELDELKEMGEKGELTPEGTGQSNFENLTTINKSVHNSISFIDE